MRALVAVLLKCPREFSRYLIASHTRAWTKIRYSVSSTFATGCSKPGSCQPICGIISANKSFSSAKAALFCSFRASGKNRRHLGCRSVMRSSGCAVQNKGITITLTKHYLNMFKRWCERGISPSFHGVRKERLAQWRPICDPITMTGGTSRKIGWGCAASFLKPLPYFRPNSVIFPTLFQTWSPGTWRVTGACDKLLRHVHGSRRKH